MSRNLRDNLKNITKEHNANSREKRDERGRDANVMVDLDVNQKFRLLKYMQEELVFYNALVNGFSARASSSPEVVAYLDHKAIELFGEMAARGVRLDALRRQPVLDPVFQPYEGMIRGKARLSEAVEILFEVASAPGAIIKQVRKNMAIAVANFYVEQAKIRMNPVSNGREDQVFRTTPLDLEIQDILRKRHVQIPRSLVTITWNEASGVCKIKFPYIEQPITTNIDLSKNNKWTTLIVQQMNGAVPTASSPWEISLKKHPAPYILKYINQLGGTNKNFNAGKPRSAKTHVTVDRLGDAGMPEAK